MYSKREANIYICINRNAKARDSWHLKDVTHWFSFAIFSKSFMCLVRDLWTQIHRQIFKLAVPRGCRSVRKYSWPVSDGTRWGFLSNQIVRLLLTLSWVLVSLGLAVNFSPFNGKFYNVCSHATALLPQLGTSTTGSKVQRKRSRLFVLRIKRRSESIVLNMIYCLDKFEKVTNARTVEKIFFFTCVKFIYDM